MNKRRRADEGTGVDEGTGLGLLDVIRYSNAILQSVEGCRP